MTILPEQFVPPRTRSLSLLIKRLEKSGYPLHPLAKLLPPTKDIINPSNTLVFVQEGSKLLLLDGRRRLERSLLEKSSPNFKHRVIKEEEAIEEWCRLNIRERPASPRWKALAIWLVVPFLKQSLDFWENRFGNRLAEKSTRAVLECLSDTSMSLIQKVKIDRARKRFVADFLQAAAPATKRKHRSVLSRRQFDVTPEEWDMRKPLDDLTGKVALFVCADDTVPVDPRWTPKSLLELLSINGILIQTTSVAAGFCGFHMKSVEFADTEQCLYPANFTKDLGFISQPFWEGMFPETKETVSMIPAAVFPRLNPIVGEKTYRPADPKTLGPDLTFDDRSIVFWRRSPFKNLALLWENALMRLIRSKPKEADEALLYLVEGFLKSAKLEGEILFIHSFNQIDFWGRLASLLHLRCIRWKAPTGPR